MRQKPNVNGTTQRQLRRQERETLQLPVSLWMATSRHHVILRQNFNKYRKQINRIEFGSPQNMFSLLAEPQIHFEFFRPIETTERRTSWTQMSLSQYNQELLSPDNLLKRWCQLYGFTDTTSVEESTYDSGETFRVVFPSFMISALFA